MSKFKTKKRMYYPSEFDYGYSLSRGVTIESLNLKLVKSLKGYYDEDCNLRLVGFNSFYSPEYDNIGIDTDGSFGFVSSRRSDFEIDSYVDDFSLAAIALMLRCFVLCNGIPVAFPDFFCEYEMRTMPLTTIGKYIIAHSGDIQIAKLFSLLLIADGRGDFRDVPPEIFSPTYQFGYEDEHKIPLL